jgi:membrane protein implicated in regulation of membrane protease activity
MWGVGVPLVILAHWPWWLVFVPIAVSSFAGRYFGEDWNPRRHQRRRRRR